MGKPTDKEIVDRLCTHASLENGWRGNPENRTVTVTLYFGSRDPIGLVKEDAHGNAKPTRELFEFWIGREKG
jgi:hypothetical protein